MVGQLTHEVEVNVAARAAWELYSSLRLAKLAEEELSTFIQKIEAIEGDGGVGTILKITYPPGTPGFTGHLEKFTKVDHEKRLKEVEVIEGGYLDMGCTFYRVRFEIIEKGNDSCIIKTTVDYDLKEEATANASFVTIETLAKVVEVTKNYLIKTKAANDAN